MFKVIVPESKHIPAWELLKATIIHFARLIIRSCNTGRPRRNISPLHVHKKFRSIRMKLACSSHVRPDCLFEIDQMAHVAEKMFNRQPAAYIRRLRKPTKYATDKRTPLKIKKLDKKTFKIGRFSDALSANNQDLSSQIGYFFIKGRTRYGCSNHLGPTWPGGLPNLQFLEKSSRSVTCSIMP